MPAKKDPLVPTLSLQHRQRTGGRPHAVPFVLGVAFMFTVAIGSGCASTTYDETLATSASTAAATTTTVPVGAARDLLPRISDEAAALAGVMIAEGDDRAVADRIVALWGAVSQEVNEVRPDLFDSFVTTVALTQKAVRFSRAADADKASKNFKVLVEAFLGS